MNFLIVGIALVCIVGLSWWWGNRESKEGAGAYDAPAYSMEPDHVHFKKVKNRF